MLVEVGNLGEDGQTMYNVGIMLRSIVRGKIVHGKSFDLEFREIPALKVRESSGNNFFLDTIWGRQVFGITENIDGLLITPDLYGGFPVFAFSNQKTLYFANDIYELLDIIPQDKLPKINKDNVLRLAFGQISNLGETVFEGIQVFNGLNQLFWDGDELQLVQWDYQSTTTKRQLSFERILQDSLAWAKEFAPGQVGVTLSGGIDSAIIWAGFKSIGITPVALTIDLPGEMGKRQEAKVEEMVNDVKAKWLRVKSDDFVFDRTRLYRDPFEDLFGKLGLLAKEAGVKVVVGGFGGDELVARAIYKQQFSTSEKKVLQKFFTPKSVEAWKDMKKLTQYKKRLLPGSAFFGSGIITGLNYEQDIWFENSLCYPDFWHWVVDQPEKWGKNKQGFRDYLNRVGYKAVANSLTSEDFADVINAAMKKALFSKDFETLFHDSKLSKWGWVDKNRILLMKNDLEKIEDETLQNLLVVYSIEKLLRYYCSKKGGDN